MASSLPDIHLDLGCGTVPRNPYGRSRLCGVDIRLLEGATGFEFRAANLTLEAIPYPDDIFGSLSAFDFVEHVPRILVTADGNGTRFPFIELMNEVWRVLAPGGRFFAVTPAVPGTAAFQDPTHVNFITKDTHRYFCGEEPPGRMYGFLGRFHALRAEWVVDGDSRSAAPLTRQQRFRRWRRRVKGQLVYFLWELEAIKPSSSL
jgi:SAM-dependent methyltransferase